MTWLPYYMVIMLVVLALASHYGNPESRRVRRLRREKRLEIAPRKRSGKP